MKNFLLAGLLLAQVGPEAGGFQSPLKPDDLDPAAFLEWVDGAERPVEGKDGPKHIVWTAGGNPGWNGLSYAASKTPGPRHLKVGFKRVIDTGTVLVRAAGLLSVLKAGAAGKLDDESQWTPAERLRKGEVERAEYGLWTLAPGTKTQALRFTHVRAASEKDYAGWIGGVAVVAGRYVEMVSQAVATSSANEHHATKILNGRHDD